MKSDIENIMDFIESQCKEYEKKDFPKIKLHNFKPKAICKITVID